METQLGHVEVRVAAANMAFYRELMTFLGWQTLFEDVEILGVGGGNGASLWFVAHANGATNDYDGAGVNHLGIATGAQGDVDIVASHLRERGIALLFETPRHRPEFAEGESATYYQVMFESPDRILLEVVYTGPKAA